MNKQNGDSGVIVEAVEKNLSEVGVELQLDKSLGLVDRMQVGTIGPLSSVPICSRIRDRCPFRFGEKYHKILIIYIVGKFIARILIRVEVLNI